MPTLDSTELVNMAKQLNIISVLTYLLPLVVCVWRWHFLPPTYRLPILFALSISFIINLLSEVGRQVWHNNLLFIYLTIWTETLFISAAYYHSFHSHRSRQLLAWGVGLFVVIALIEFIYWHGLYGTRTYTRTAQSILLVGAALVYFEQVLQELRNIKLENDPMFLVSVGVTLYYSGTLMVFVLEDSMHKHQQTNQVWTMYIIESILLIVFNALLALALYHASDKSRQRVQSEV